MTISCRTGKFASDIRWARRYLPIPIRFRTSLDVRDNEGNLCDALLTDRGNGWYTITFDRYLTYSAAVDSLLHELAHAIDIHRRGWGKDHYHQHGDSWGVEHSRIYRDYWEQKGK